LMREAECCRGGWELTIREKGGNAVEGRELREARQGRKRSNKGIRQQNRKYE